MRINITQIPKEGLSLHETSAAASLNLNTAEINFISPVEISAQVAKVSNRLLVNVRVSGLAESVCSRCLEEFKLDFFKEFKFDYSLKENEQTLDITDDIRQEITLSYPIKFLCKDDCKGLCSVCGQNLNKGDCSHALT